MTSSNSASPYGFRILGNCTNDRRLIDWPSAFVAYSQCDERAEVNREAYLSAFKFGDDFARYLNETGSTKGYTGETGAAWLWFDIDREDDIDAATADARKLAAALSHGYGIEGDALLCFFSGSKGYHVGFPLSVCRSPAPSANFHDVCKRFALSVAEPLGVSIDVKVYDRVRAFRAPNSRHQKTGLHKRHLAFDALMNLRPARLIEMAAEPEPFEIPDPPEPVRLAVDHWAAAVAAVTGQHEAIRQRRETIGAAKLNRQTADFIRDGAADGDRANRLFSAAANLAEFASVEELAFELLTEPGLDSGLSPSEVQRQIECGLNHRAGHYQPSGLAMKPPEPSGTEAGN